MTVSMPELALAEPAGRSNGQVLATSAPHRWSRRVAADLVGFLDAGAVVAGGMIPALVYVATAGLAIDWMKHLQICLVSSVIVCGCLKNYGLYDTGRMHAFPVAPASLAASLAIAFMAVLGLGMPFAPKEVHMWIWYGAWIATSFALLLNVRIASRAVLSRLTVAGAFDERVAVYGSGGVARRVEGHLRNPGIGIHFAGLYDDRGDPSRLDLEGLTLAGRLDDLVAAARNGSIDSIVIALPQTAEDRTSTIARRLEHLPVSLHIVTHIASDLVEAGPAHRVSSLGPVGLLDVKKKPLADWARIVKLVEDYVLAALLIVPAMLLMAVIAAAIRIDSRGPVLFRQRRRGRNHRVFEMFKFRTMRVLEDGADVRQATKDDPRVTRVGWWLRRTSLDELPQLFNVLLGDMSLVGPRPHALAHDDRFAETVERYANRQQVKPGITGLAQVSGLRGGTETQDKIERRIALDLEYVNGWSLWLDLKILGLTLVRGLAGQNAY